MPEAIYNTAVFFKNSYKDEWITSPFGREVIAAVDKSTVISAGLIDSPVFGSISPLQLSGGVKTLLLIAGDKQNRHIFNASTCGDNCMKWLLKLAEGRKITVNLRHLPDFGAEPFKIRVLNTGKIVKNMRELVLEAGEFV